MSQDLLQPQSYLPPAQTLHVSQQAPQFFRSQASSILSLPYPLSFLTTSESPEKWQTYENLLIACLRSGDDQSASTCLKHLIARFGESNERIQVLSGLYDEATAEDDKALVRVLTKYDDLLKDTPANFPIRKRRAALLRSMGKTTEAITALKELLDASPIDAEAWSELADLYFTQSLHSQAIFCLEEVLLITPNAWNIHAKLGEVTYISANATEEAGDQLKLLSEAMRNFCRSIELCDYYLRGYYGLKLTTTRLLQALNKTTTGKPLKASSDISGDLAPPTLASVQRLNEVATSKLAEILRRGSSGEKNWDGYEPAELIAVKELLSRDTQSITR